MNAWHVEYAYNHVDLFFMGIRLHTCGQRAGLPAGSLPVTSLNVGLQRQNDGLSEEQVARNVKQAVLAKLGNPAEDDVIMELSQEVYFLDGSREWTLSSQTMQHVDNQTLVETSLRQPRGVLREVSYQLFKGDEVLLPLEEVFSDFDTICERGWQERGITPKFCVWRQAPMFFVNCRGRLLDSYQPALKEARAVAFTAWQGHAFFYKNARSVYLCDDVERLRGNAGSPRSPSSRSGASGTAACARGTSGPAICGGPGRG